VIAKGLPNLFGRPGGGQGRSNAEKLQGVARRDEGSADHRQGRKKGDDEKIVTRHMKKRYKRALHRQTFT